MKNVRKMLNLIYKLDKSFIYINFALNLLKVMNFLLLVYFPYILFNNYIQGLEVKGLYKIVIVYLGAELLLNLLINYLDKEIVLKSRSLNYNIELEVAKKVVEVNYEQVEDPSIHELKEKALFPIKNQGVIDKFIVEIGSVLSLSLSICTLGTILLRIHYSMFILILLTLGVNIYLNKKSSIIEKNNIGGIVEANRYYVYYFRLVTNFIYAKDIRVFNMKPLINSKILEYKKKMNGLYKNTLIKQSRYKGLIGSNLEIQTMIVAIILVLNLYRGRQNLADLVIVLGALGSLAVTTQGLINSFMQISLQAHYFEGYFQFFKRLEKKVDTGSIEIDKIDTIEFRGVSFRYPKQEVDVLKGVDLEFHKGINYSLVGLNGAGKTTLIKLLTKLYKPTEGKILINGTDLEEIDTVSYRNALSCVFQDFKMFAFNLEENITMDREVDRNRVETLIDEVGMGEKVAKLKNGLKTQIYKIFDKEGIEFSGGQSQKLAIARARYRDGDLLIFDEPTASLDPIAEEEIFRNLYSIMEEEKETKISIFISHRLSSCRLSDQIYVLDKGSIIEKGSFEKLTDNSDGLFNKMWNKQAEYYIVEDEEEKAV